MDLIKNNVSLGVGNSKWQWVLDNSQGYSSRLVSTKIDDIIIEKSGHLQGTMKNNYLPQKIGIFVWRALRGRIPVREELDKRGIDLDSLLCPMCNDFIESVDHVLISCKAATDVWKAIYNWWGSSPPNFDSLQKLFSGSGRGILS
ncbi:uncharacterized protein [Rutidosis leptorrhynchoides]|uniref:uncharacterized protein n=1 Tax=Rutidosis leptorrhynchoides TaxID=125765 RepID=UPI003A998398